MRRSPKFVSSFAISVLLTVAAPASAADGEVDLLGGWHVLVHFTDSGAEDTEALRWDDRLWKFEMKGGRLHWTEYPIVVFDDMRGRFTLLGGTTRARVQEFWEPNASQQRNIRDGLEVNERQSRAKSLRGSMQRGFRSSGGLRSASTSVIGYAEVWSVADPATRPVFTRDDLLGSGRTEGMAGRTRYSTTEILEGGLVLRGTFERDGTATGSFRMTRAGEPLVVAGVDEHDPDEAVEISLGFAVDRGALFYELEALLASPDPNAERARARKLIHELIQEDLRQRGQDPLGHYPRIESLSDKVSTLLFDEGVSLEEVDVMLLRRELLP